MRFNPKLFIKYIVILFATHTLNINASVLDSLQNLLNTNINDSVRFEIYNQIFPRIVKQNIDSAKKCLDVQNKILQNTNFSKTTIDEFYTDIYNNSGIYYNRKGNQDTAIFFHEKALEIAKKHKKNRVVAITLNNIANIFFLQGNYKVSLDYHLKALKIRKEIADSNGIAMSYGNIGLIHSNLKEYDRSIDYYNKAKDIFVKQNDKRAISWVYRAIGVAYLDLKQYTKALKNLNKSLNIATATQNFSGIKYCLLNKSLVYLGLYKQTQKHNLLDSTEKTCFIIDSLQNKSYIKRIDINNLKIKSQVLFYKNKFNKALTLINKAEKLLKEIDLKTELKDIFKLKSDIYEAKGNFEYALKYYKKFKTLTDSLFTIEKQKEIGRKEAWFEYNEKLKIEKIKSENQIKLSKSEKEKLKLWLIVITLLSIILLTVFVFVYKKLTKEKRLLNQQKNLILQKYTNIEEAYNEALSNIEQLKSLKENNKYAKPLPDWINSLSKRETEVLSCVAVGLSDKEISDKLFISVTTVRTHCQRIYGKLLVKNRMEAANLAREYKLI